MAVITVKVGEKTIAMAKKYYNEVYLPLNALSLAKTEVTDKWFFDIFTCTRIERPHSKMLNAFMKSNDLFGLFMWDVNDRTDTEVLYTTANFDLIKTIATFMGTVNMALSDKEYRSFHSFLKLDVDAIALNVQNLKDSINA
jgi:hypothetical protein